MKCPKCGYLGFDDVERCRNCGYDFSLVPAPDPELEIRSAAPTPAVLDDLALIDAAQDVDTTSPAPTPVLAKLPLFGGESDDLPLITKLSPPRPPLAVRRATPEMPRPRPEASRPALLDLSEPASDSRSGMAARHRTASAPVEADRHDAGGHLLASRGGRHRFRSAHGDRRPRRVLHAADLRAHGGRSGDLAEGSA